MKHLLISILLATAAFGQAQGETATFRVGVIPAEFFSMFGLPITPETKGKDQVTVTVTSGDAVAYLITVKSKLGKSSRQIALRPEGVCVGEACNALRPLAQFWAEGGVERVIVEPLIAGVPAVQQMP